MSQYPSTANRSNGQRARQEQEKHVEIIKTLS